MKNWPLLTLSLLLTTAVHALDVPNRTLRTDGNADSLKRDAENQYSWEWGLGGSIGPAGAAKGDDEFELGDLESFGSAMGATAFIRFYRVIGMRYSLLYEPGKMKSNLVSQLNGVSSIEHDLLVNEIRLECAGPVPSKSPSRELAFFFALGYSIPISSETIHLEPGYQLEGDSGKDLVEFNNGLMMSFGADFLLSKARMRAEFVITSRGADVADESIKGTLLELRFTVEYVQRRSLR